MGWMLAKDPGENGPGPSLCVPAEPVLLRRGECTALSRATLPLQSRRPTRTPPLRDIQRLLRHARPETTPASCDISGDALERHASHQVAGFLAGWADQSLKRDRSETVTALASCPARTRTHCFRKLRAEALPPPRAV